MTLTNTTQTYDVSETQNGYTITGTASANNYVLKGFSGEFYLDENSIASISISIGRNGSIQISNIKSDYINAVLNNIVIFIATLKAKLAELSEANDDDDTVIIENNQSTDDSSDTTDDDTVTITNNQSAEDQPTENE